VSSFTKTFDVVPVGKPRMTQRDKWKPSLAAKRYFSFKDSITVHILEDSKLRAFLKEEDVYHVEFTAFLPIPISWAKSKKVEAAGKFHRQKPDVDNIEKALLDAIFPDDSAIAVTRGAKFWADEKGPRLEVTFHSLGRKEEV
jgi:Holliday junction resolvase RusA-like endonuclease